MSSKKKKNKKINKSRDLEEDDLAIYLLVRTDLGMGKGKIATQIGHAIEDLMICSGGMGPMWRKYRRECGSRKICYGISENGLWSVVDFCRENKISCSVISDAGRTQVPAGTVTCAAIGPISKSSLGDSMKELKLLK